MRVLVNAVSARSGGSASYLRNLLGALGPLSPRIEWVVCMPAEQARALDGGADGVRIVSVEPSWGGGWRRLVWDQVRLRRRLRREQIDVLVSSSDFGVLRPPCPQVLYLRNALFFSGVYRCLILAGKSRRARLDFAVRRRLVFRSAQASTVVPVATNGMKRAVAARLPCIAGKLRVNPFGVPLDRFIPRAARREGGALRLLFVSEYADYKNLTTLLHAVKLLRVAGRRDVHLTTTADPEQFPDVELVSRARDRAWAADPMVAPALRITGSIPYDEVPRLYQESDVFVFPSLVESFGHPLVEAMASGLPVIASDVPVCREVCADGASYFDPQDAGALARRIAALGERPERRAELGAIGRRRAETLFDCRAHLARLVDLVEEVAAGEARLA